MCIGFNEMIADHRRREKTRTGKSKVLPLLLRAVIRVRCAFFHCEPVWLLAWSRIHVETHAISISDISALLVFLINRWSPLGTSSPPSPTPLNCPGSPRPHEAGFGATTTKSYTTAAASSITLIQFGAYVKAASKHRPRTAGAIPHRPPVSSRFRSPGRSWRGWTCGRPVPGW